MSAPSEARAPVAAALLMGERPRDIAARLHFALPTVYGIRRQLVRANLLLPRREAHPYTPWVAPDSREAALARGKALALAKVASGEWVLPQEVRR